MADIGKVRLLATLDFERRKALNVGKSWPVENNPEAVCVSQSS